MIVTLKDLVTGEIATDSGGDIWEYTEGNWSCDCNRCLSFGKELELKLVQQHGRGYCFGNERIIVIDLVEEDGDFEGYPKEDLISEMNRGYKL
jgi:hypothetical protein